MKTLLLICILGMFFSLKENEHRIMPYYTNKNCLSTIVDIVEESIFNVDVLFKANYEDKHRFAHGRLTKYGRLSFDSDMSLRYNCGLSNKNLHEIGFMLGFSERRR